MKKYMTYTVHPDGRIISRFGREIKTHISNAGYIRVELWDKGLGRKYSLHRVLAELYVPNPKCKPQVNHIDGNKLNNSISNLEWVTQSENQKHAYKTGLQNGYKKPTPLSKSHKKALCGSRWIGEKRIYHAEGMQFKTPKEAAEYFGFNRQTFYNRAKSEEYKSWNIEIMQEEK